MSDTPSHDIIVVGAGVIGSAVARELSTDHDILVVDKSVVGGGASGMAAGLTAPTLFAYERPPVADYANRFLREFSGTEGFVYNTRSRVELVVPEMADEARKQAERMAENGFPVSFTTTKELETRYSLLDLNRFEGAIVIEDAGFIEDTYEYTCALARDAEKRGTQFRTNVEVTDIIAEGGEIAGVKTNDGAFNATTVVVAAGWRTRRLLDEIVSVPIRPFRLQSASIDPQGDFEQDFPLGRLTSEDVYFRPQNNGHLRLGGGEYLVDDPYTYSEGITDAEHFNGNTDHESATTPELVDNGIDSSFGKRVKNTVPLFISNFEYPSDVDIIAGWSSLDAATLDAEPIIDTTTTGPDGLIIATGFNGLGITKSPLAAAGVRSLVTGEKIPFSLDHFSLNRLPNSFEFKLQDTFMMGTNNS